MMRLCFASLLLLLSAMPLDACGDGLPGLASGDALFLRMDYHAAVQDYEAALSEASPDPELLWRIARACVCIGEVEEDAHKRLTVLRKAEACARRCIASESGCPEGHTWLAAALGYLALEGGIQEQVALSRELLAETDRALALDPRNDAALSIRGSFFRALGNVGWFKKQLASLFVGEIPDGGFAEAEKSLLEAIAIAPDIMRHQYELGILYTDMDRIPDACRAFERASSLPVRVAIDRPRLAKIHAFLEELHCGSK